MSKKGDRLWKKSYRTYKAFELSEFDFIQNADISHTNHILPRQNKTKLHKLWEIK